MSSCPGFFSTCEIIYFVEGPKDSRISLRISSTATGADQLCVSELSVLECKVLPLRNSDYALVQAYDKFFADPDLGCLEVSRAVLNTAARLRAVHGLRTPDAIQAASAITLDADVFLTNDASFKRVTEIDVELVEPG
ncbi:MAG: type II toxin-antitoxin system VapC family toxin [Candidatus Sumerlaeaceae bacterium]